MNIEISKRTVAHIALVVLLLGSVGLCIWLLLNVSQYKAEKAILEDRIANLEVRLSEQEQKLIAKDSEISQLSETKQQLTKSVETLEAQKPAKEAVSEALQALRRLEAAMKVGSDFFNFNRLITDAQAQVTEASNLLPKGKLKSALESAMVNYESALRSLRGKAMERDEELKFYHQQQADYFAIEGSKQIGIAASLAR